MKYYRVKDLAERYDVTRQTIHYYLNRLSFVDKNKYLSYKGKIVLINQAGVNYLDLIISNVNALPEEKQEQALKIDNNKDLSAFLDLVKTTYATKQDLIASNNKLIIEQKNDIKDLTLKYQKSENTIRTDINNLTNSNNHLKLCVIILSLFVLILLILCLILFFNTFEIV